LAFYVEKIPHPDKFSFNAILTRCWFPRHCGYSGKFLWLRKAYRLESYDYGLRDEFYQIYSWIDKDIYLIMKIKGEL